MPVTKDAPGPYAPAAAVLGIVDRFRSKGLPTPIDAEVLGRAGVSLSLIPRTLQALRLLDLIDESGAPTDTLESIRLAPEAEYPATLAKWLEATYADVLQFVDPATATESNLTDAFRSYQPQGQQPRMITLFTGLFRAAGIGPEKAVASLRKASKATPPRDTGRKAKRDPIIKNIERQLGGSGGGSMHPALAGVLASLPDPAVGWTQADYDRFIPAFEAVLKFAIPIRSGIKTSGDADAPR
jgi:hypothetical protein